MRYIILLISLLLFGCAQPTNNSSKKSKKNADYIRLLSKFKEIVFDTMHVFPLSDGMNYEKYKFNGIQLDSVDAILFPKDIAERHFVDPPGLFACYKFKIDSLRTGLIARTPAEYYPSSIKLFIYTTNKDTLIETIELAQFIGDAGALRDINSWIFTDSDKTIKAFTWLQDSEDNSVEDEKDTTISTWNYFSLYNISTGRLDSLGSKPEYLPLKLATLLKQRINR
jgi:hypothetical protein